MFTRNEMLDYLHNEHVSFVDVQFRKKDGTIRNMGATLNLKSIPTNEFDKLKNDKRTYNDEVIRVWDIDMGAWRSFRVDSVISFEPVHGQAVHYF